MNSFARPAALFLVACSCTKAPAPSCSDLEHFALAIGAEAKIATLKGRDLPQGWQSVSRESKLGIEGPLGEVEPGYWSVFIDQPARVACLRAERSSAVECVLFDKMETIGVCTPGPR